MGSRSSRSPLVGVGITAVTGDLLAGPSTGSYAGGRAPEERSSSDRRPPLDPAHPWSYRGDLPVTQQELDVYQAEYDARHPEGASFSPLFGQVYEPSRSARWCSWPGRRRDRHWGVVRGSEAGPEFVLDERLPADPTALVAALPGDEQARLLVVAEPTPPGRAPYAGRGAVACRCTRSPTGSGPRASTATRPATGSASPTPADGCLQRDRARHRLVGDAAGAGGTPGNVLSDWPQRGTMPPGLLEESVAAYATSRSAPATNVDTAVLFAGDDDAGKRYLLAQMWVRGDTVATPSATSPEQRGGGEPELQLKSRLAFDASVVAMVVSPRHRAARRRWSWCPGPAPGRCSTPPTARRSGRSDRARTTWTVWCWSTGSPTPSATASACSTATAGSSSTTPSSTCSAGSRSAGDPAPLLGSCPWRST